MFIVKCILTEAFSPVNRFLMFIIKFYMFYNEFYTFYNKTQTYCNPWQVNSNPRIPFVTQDSQFVNESPVL